MAGLDSTHMALRGVTPTKGSPGVMDSSRQVERAVRCREEHATVPQFGNPEVKVAVIVNWSPRLGLRRVPLAALDNL